MLAVIGGTGVYQLEGISVVKEHHVDTPFGQPSSPIIEGKVDVVANQVDIVANIVANNATANSEGRSRTVFFLARHGQQHQLMPAEVNYCANIWALKSLGVTQVIGLSAVGSLREEIAPGDLSVPAQYFDFVKGHRDKSFFGNGLVAHVSTAEPTCPELTKAIAHAASDLNITLHTDKTYGCVDGPRLGTRAESFFLRDAAGCDLVGMTNVPEVFLAREAQLCYATIAIATDYDCWMDDPAHHVTVEQVISRYGASLAKAKELLSVLLTKDADIPESKVCREALAMAVLTPDTAMSIDHKNLLEVLKA